MTVEDKTHQEAPLLEVSDLSVTYGTEAGTVNAVRHVSFRIQRGESYGLVGESGSGKTTLASAIVRFLPDNGRIASGRVLLNGVNLLDLPASGMRKVWGAQIAVVPQNPSTSVNPSIVIGEQIAEVARLHLGLSKADAWRKSLEMLTQVGMPDPEAVAMRYAHQLSGGMLQRVLIATALTTSPQLLIMDEPTTALDVTTQAVILDLIHDLMAQYQAAVLYITHNLGVVSRVCDRVGVMYAGELLEEGSIHQVYKETTHPYTLGLLGCVPRIDASKHEVDLRTIPGFIPRLDQLPQGCVFAPRCPIIEETCNSSHPTLVESSAGHMSACRRWEALQNNRDCYSGQQVLSSNGVKAEAGTPLLQANHIQKHFNASRGGLNIFSHRQARTVRAVDDISIEVTSGSTLGVVGESGSGKTTLARCICGLEEATAGEVRLEGEKLAPSVMQRSANARKKLQMVFQNPESSLNPQQTVGAIVGRPLAQLRARQKNQIPGQVAALLRAVHLPESYMERMPYELSGGEKQRVAIARAFAADPTLVICDEPISSLDVSVQASLLNLLAELQRSQGTAYLFVSHDLAAIRHISDWIAVVYLGRLWEIGPSQEVFSAPCHPYTEALLSAIPILDPDVQQERVRLAGSVPSAIDIPAGCRFHPRCPRKLGAICETQDPDWQSLGPNHRIRCHIPGEKLAELQRGILGTL